jgi:HK97 family phage portal protein
MGIIRDLFDIHQFKKEERAIKQSGGSLENPQNWLMKMFGGNATLAGVDVDADTAMKYSAIWSAVNRISGTIGFLPFNVYERVGERGKKKATAHPVFDLLRYRPNPFMTAQVFRETLQAHVLWGNGYAEIERDGASRPINLWLLLPNMVRPVMENGQLVYKVTDRRKNIEAVIPAEDMLHIPGLGYDGLKGYSVIEYMAENTGLSLATEKNMAGFLGNDSSPPGYLESDNPLKKETMDETEKRWEEKHRGTDKKYRVAILHSGLHWKASGISAKDSQLIETRTFNVTDVARWFEISPHLLADLGRATWGNVESLFTEFVVLTLQKWITKWEQECNRKLFSELERARYFAEFLISGLLRGDTASQTASFTAGRTGGWLCVNDIREMINLNPIDNGDIYLEPLNMKEAGQTIVQVPPAKPAPDANQANNYRALLYDTWRRITTKEVNALRKAGDNGQFDTFIDEFYAEHRNYVLQLIEPVLRLLADKADVNVLVDSYVIEQKTQLRQAKSNGSLAAVFTRWQNDLPADRTERILKDI